MYQERVAFAMTDFKQLTEKDAQDAPVKDIQWDVSQQQTKESETKLEQDVGSGQPAIIRQFMFKTNPQTWKSHPPTKQELFNHHLKQIEIWLWQDA